MAKYGDEIKKIVFYDSDKRHADLKVRLKYDCLKQSEFFRLLIESYLSKDHRILSVVDDYKGQKSKQSKAKRSKISELYKKAEKVKGDFALGGEDIENIFDLLEKEHPDL